VKPIVKKAAAAIAIKEGIDKLQEMRKPQKPSLIQRLMPFGIVAAIAGLGFFLYKNKTGESATGNYDANLNSNASGGSF